MIMKIGDVLYLVPKGFPRSEAFLTPVWFVGKSHFSAGEYTFEFPATAQAFVGSHWRFGKAYASKAAHEESIGKRDGWQELRYIVRRADDAPEHLSADDIASILKIIKG